MSREVLVELVLEGTATELLDLARRRRTRCRINRLRPDGQRTAPGRRRWPVFRGRPKAQADIRREWGAEWAVPLAAGLGVTALLGGPVGLVAGVALTMAARRWLPRPKPAAVRRKEREQELLTCQLPLAAELLAACLGVSSSPTAAAVAVAGSVGPPMRERLAATAAELSLGAPPELCWERLGEGSPPLAPLARCLVRTSVSGAPPAAPLTGLAQAQRAAARRTAHARVRRAGVLATAPLGVCFLPAFVFIGVLPVVMGLTTLFAQRI